MGQMITKILSKEINKIDQTVQTTDILSLTGLKERIEGIHP